MQTTAIQGLGASSPLSDASPSALGKDDFLKLLVAQLSHQDPLEPVQNSEFIAQLAQFSSLEQMTNVNDNLGLMQIAMASTSNNQVAGLIGKEIEARGETLHHTSPGPTAVNFDLAATASEVTIKIFNESGNLIRTVQTGARAEGVNSVSWDGNDDSGSAVPDGKYRVEVAAKDSAGNQIVAHARFTGVVTGVTYENGLPKLEVGNAPVPVGDVIAVRTPQKAATGGP